MRFALLGDHADGIDLARALAQSGRHEVAIYSGPPAGLILLERWDLRPVMVGDLEEILADPSIEALIIASSPALRGAQLRRGLQSERHCLCVHPLDQKSDAAYETSLLQADAGVVLLPILPEAMHPGIRRLAQLARPSRSGGASGETSAKSANSREEHITARPASMAFSSTPLSVTGWNQRPRLIEIERWFSGPAGPLVELEKGVARPGLVGWETLRLLGGEIAEVMVLGPREEITREGPLLLSGQFVEGGMFQATYLSDQPENRWKISLLGKIGRAELLFPQGWPGSAQLTYPDETGRIHEESFEEFDPYQSLVEAFEQAVEWNPRLRPDQLPNYKRNDSLTTKGELTWQDEIRGLDLDDAAHRSISRRRVSTLEYVEAADDASFKGTMTLVGCSLLWMCLVLLILSVWLPWMGWLVLPTIVIFLGLQFMGYFFPPPKPGEKPAGRNTGTTHPPGTFSTSQKRPE